MRPRIELDYYAILGVAADADGVAIQKAYRGRAKRCHPDVFPNGSSERVRAESGCGWTVSGRRPITIPAGRSPCGSTYTSGARAIRTGGSARPALRSAVDAILPARRHAVSALIASDLPAQVISFSLGRQEYA